MSTSEATVRQPTTITPISEDKKAARRNPAKLIRARDSLKPTMKHLDAYPELRDEVQALRRKVLDKFIEEERAED